MIKDKLNKLYDLKLDMQVNYTIHRLNEKYDELEITNILNNGIYLKPGILLKYYGENVGFQCIDEFQHVRGKSALSQNIERFLNRKR